MIKQTELLGLNFIVADIEESLEEVLKYISKKNGHYFCFVNLHVLMECNKNAGLKKMMNESAANFADGMGVVYALKFLGNRFKERIRGTDLMFKICAYAAKNNLKIALYGNTDEVLVVLKKKLEELYPGIHIVDIISPPFRELTANEDEAMVNRINANNPDILFISLGAPKQEKWVAQHKGKVKAIQLAVGAAFNFIVGKIKPAPLWMQRLGLEWLYRLPQEPKKVILRMLLVPEFIFGILRQFIQESLLSKKEKT